MGKIYESSLELVGGTPLLRLSRYAGRAGIVDVEILAKLEYLNPAGSVKDRTALAMIEDAERKGILKPGATIIEPTSGNTGIGLAAAAAVKGYQTILTLPDTMSMERRSLLGAYGARLVLTEGAAGMNGAIARAEELQKEIPGSVILGQFENAANSQVHRELTGPEIWEQTDGKVDIFVAGVGTGGTVTGVGEYLKSRNPAVRGGGGPCRKSCAVYESIRQAAGDRSQGGPGNLWGSWGSRRFEEEWSCRDFGGWGKTRCLQRESDSGHWGRICAGGVEYRGI